MTLAHPANAAAISAGAFLEAIASCRLRTKRTLQRLRRGTGELLRYARFQCRRRVNTDPWVTGWFLSNDATPSGVVEAMT